MRGACVWAQAVSFTRGDWGMSGDVLRGGVWVVQSTLEPLGPPPTYVHRRPLYQAAWLGPCYLVSHLSCPLRPSTLPSPRDSSLPSHPALTPPAPFSGWLNMNRTAPKTPGWCAPSPLAPALFSPALPAPFPTLPSRLRSPLRPRSPGG